VDAAIVAQHQDDVRLGAAQQQRQVASAKQDARRHRVAIELADLPQRSSIDRPQRAATGHVEPRSVERDHLLAVGQLLDRMGDGLAGLDGDAAGARPGDQRVAARLAEPGEDARDRARNGRVRWQALQIPRQDPRERVAVERPDLPSHELRRAVERRQPAGRHRAEDVVQIHRAAARDQEPAPGARERDEPRAPGQRSVRQLRGHRARSPSPRNARSPWSFSSPAGVQVIPLLRSASAHVHATSEDAKCSTGPATLTHAGHPTDRSPARTRPLCRKHKTVRDLPAGVKSRSRCEALLQRRDQARSLRC